MWSALQTLHRCRSRVPRPPAPLDWASPYERLVTSEQSCLNEWHAMADIESRRPPSPDSRRHCVSTEREETERVIRARLREIMLSVDLDQVTSKELRVRLEEEMGCCLKPFKAFIDAEMLVIMGQMDHASRIFEHLYLGSEWNASDLEELKQNRIGHILNVTREIDNFFPGKFQYQNVRVYDEEATELLKHWDKTYKFINKAKGEGSRVLVHCRMGVSRSAAVVIAYAMKAYGWSYEKALHHVKQRRGCVKPNASFLRQLETYQGILDASKQRHNSLWRSKSETNLQSGRLVSPVLPPDGQPACQPVTAEDGRRPRSPAPPTAAAGRPKSWSPADAVAEAVLAELTRCRSHSQTLPGDTAGPPPAAAVNLRVPCNGQDYRVSQNQAMNLSLPLEPAGALRPDPAPPAVYQCVNKQLVPTADAWVGQVVELRSAPLRQPAAAASAAAEPLTGLVRRHAEDFERRSSSSEGARGSCGSAELAPPSRQSSWSSLEGALLRAAGLQSPSRSSSWGSYDAATPAEEAARSPAVAHISVQLRPPAPRPLAASHQQAVSMLNLSAAAPPCRPALSSVSLTEEVAPQPAAATPGQVRRLARQLEAAAGGRHKRASPAVPTPDSPSSPDEVRVRWLVDRFEAAPQPSCAPAAVVGGGATGVSSSSSSSHIPPAAPARKASLDLSRLASFTRRNLGQVFGRHRTVSQPPVPVVRTAQRPPPAVAPDGAAARQPAPHRKRLHGKTHPLARLDVRARHVSSVFHTM